MSRASRTWSCGGRIRRVPRERTIVRAVVDHHRNRHMRADPCGAAPLGAGGVLAVVRHLLAVVPGVLPSVHEAPRTPFRTNFHRWLGPFYGVGAAHVIRACQFPAAGRGSTKRDGYHPEHRILGRDRLEGFDGSRSADRNVRPCPRSQVEIALQDGWPLPWIDFDEPHDLDDGRASNSTHPRAASTFLTQLASFPNMETR